VTRELLARSLAPRAQRELRNAVRWIVDDSPEAGLALIAALTRTVAMLKANPLLGRQRLELAPANFRFWLLRGFPYVLVYSVAHDPPLIVRVIHQSRDLSAALDDGL
jgi:toxin ParE1/3/4